MRDTIDMAREAGIEFQRTMGPLGKETISTMGSQRLEKIERFEALVRADERAQLVQQIDWTALLRKGGLVTWGDASDLGDRVCDAILAGGEIK